MLWQKRSYLMHLPEALPLVRLCHLIIPLRRWPPGSIIRRFLGAGISTGLGFLLSGECLPDYRRLGAVVTGASYAASASTVSVLSMYFRFGHVLAIFSLPLTNCFFLFFFYASFPFFV